MLKPSELKAGDECRHPSGELSYTVIQKRHVEGGVRALVRHLDGGTDWREWPEELADRPVESLVRPT